MGVPTINTSTWFGAGTASTAVLTPAQVAAVAPLVSVTAAYVVMYYAFLFFSVVVEAVFVRISAS